MDLLFGDCRLFNFDGCCGLFFMYLLFGDFDFRNTFSNVLIVSSIVILDVVMDFLTAILKHVFDLTLNLSRTVSCLCEHFFRMVKHQSRTVQFTVLKDADLQILLRHDDDSTSMPLPFTVELALVPVLTELGPLNKGSFLCEVDRSESVVGEAQLTVLQKVGQDVGDVFFAHLIQVPEEMGAFDKLVVCLLENFERIVACVVLNDFMHDFYCFRDDQCFELFIFGRDFSFLNDCLFIFLERFYRFFIISFNI